MASRIVFDMEPNIVLVCNFQRQSVVLEIVFAYKNCETVGGLVFGRLAGLGLFLSLSFLFSALFYIALFGQFSAYLSEFRNGIGIFHRTANGFEVFDLRKRFGNLLRKHFFRRLCLFVKFIVFLRVCGGGKSRVEFHGTFRRLFRIIIHKASRFFSAFQQIHIRRYNISVTLEYVGFFAFFQFASLRFDLAAQTGNDRRYEFCHVRGRTLDMLRRRFDGKVSFHGFGRSYFGYLFCRRTILFYVKAIVFKRLVGVKKNG